MPRPHECPFSTELSAIPTQTPALNGGNPLRGSHQDVRTHSGERKKLFLTLESSK